MNLNKEMLEDWESLVDNMPVEIYLALKKAIELGKWPDGERLDREQLENCMQAVILYDHKNKNESDRIGYIDKGEKEGSSCSDPDNPMQIPVTNETH